MSSQKRKDASRKNGALGGPKSPEGKARSSENAIKHNLYAKHCKALSTESEELFIELRTRLFREYDPQTTIESETVEQLVMAAWRVRRYARCQTWFLEIEMAQQAEWISRTGGPPFGLFLPPGPPVQARFGEKPPAAPRAGKIPTGPSLPANPP